LINNTDKIKEVNYKIISSTQN